MENLYYQQLEEMSEDKSYIVDCIINEMLYTVVFDTMRDAEVFIQFLSEAKIKHSPIVIQK